MQRGRKVAIIIYRLPRGEKKFGKSDTGHRFLENDKNYEKLN